MLVTEGRAGYGCFLTYGTFCFAMFFFVWFFVKETKGLSLEKMDDIFGVTELVKDLEQAKVDNEHIEEVQFEGPKK